MTPLVDLDLAAYGRRVAAMRLSELVAALRQPLDADHRALVAAALRRLTALMVDAPRHRRDGWVCDDGVWTPP